MATLPAAAPTGRDFGIVPIADPAPSMGRLVDRRRRPLRQPAQKGSGLRRRFAQPRTPRGREALPLTGAVELIATAP